MIRLDAGNRMLTNAIIAGGIKIIPMIAYPPERPPFGIPNAANMITAIIIHGIIMPYENALSIRAIFPGPITRLTFDRNSLPQFGHELGKSKGHGRSNISIYFAQR
jgi:hypothetical protein